MSRWVKVLIGLAAALAAALIHYWPLGGGETFIASLEERAEARLRAVALPGVEVRMKRDPLSRVVILSGPANDFQKEGMGSYPGLNDRMRSIPGVSGVEWE